MAASSESGLSTSDVERAYLNALAIDRNIVVIASSDLHPIPRRSLLIKALYGARCSAKSWQDWSDDKMVTELEYKKLKIGKGIYLKVDEVTGDRFPKFNGKYVCLKAMRRLQSLPMRLITCSRLRVDTLSNPS